MPLVDRPPSLVPASDSPDFNARVLQPLAWCIRDRYGAEVLDHVIAASGVSPDAVSGKSHWISHAQFEAVIGAARALFPSDETFRDACAYKLADAYGPFRFFLWAASLRTVYIAGAKNMPVISSVSAYEIEDAGPNTLLVRYRTKRPETRLMCLSRLGQMFNIPTIWGYPAAHVVEESCIAKGDDCCAYRVRLYERRRWFPIIGGAALGAISAFLFTHFGLDAHAAHASLPLAGALVGGLLEMQRANKTNMNVFEEINAGLRELGEQDAAARQELIALHQRQRDWAKLMEREVQDRTVGLQRVLQQVESIESERISTLRGFSHDLRSPLAAMRVNAHYLKSQVSNDNSSSAMGAIVDLEESIARMQRMLSDLMTTVARLDAPMMKVRLDKVAVPPLTDRIRKQLRAFTFGRDVRISVFATREAPSAISTDPMLLDRVLDNILTNAAKYTERGSIVVEVGGTPRFLTVKVSDTGRGIEEADIERIFRPRGSSPGHRASDSYGLGLSIVVRLLAEIGGRIEVMSQPDVGTTFWIHVPVDPSEHVGLRAQESAADADLLGNVVTIRRAHVS
jgi:signal transduction histidine kinase